MPDSDIAQSPSLLPRPLRGVVPPLVTPLRSPETLDVAALHRIIERVLAGSVHGVFILGSTGELPSLQMDLRRAVIEETCTTVAGRVPVIVNVSETAFLHSLHLARLAADAGAVAVALSPPCYFPLHQDHVLSNARRFAEASPLPVFLYNVPQYAHNEITPETVQALSQIPNIIGLKNSNGRLDYLVEVRKAVAHRPDFTVLVGNEETLFPALLAGADGGVCGGANMFPDLYVQLYESTIAGRSAEAEALHATIVHLADSIYTVGHPQSSYLCGLKCALSSLGVIENVLAEPLQPLNTPDRIELEARLERVLATIGKSSY